MAITLVAIQTLRRPAIVQCSRTKRKETEREAFTSTETRAAQSKGTWPRATQETASQWTLLLRAITWHTTEQLRTRAMALSIIRVYLQARS
jgi:hypothetical protein